MAELKNSPEPRMRDVARRLGVSLATVSLALRSSPRVAESTQLRVIDAARELGYEVPRPRTPNRLLRLGFLAINQPLGDADDEESAFSPITRVFSGAAAEFDATFSFRTIAGTQLDARNSHQIEAFVNDNEGLIVSGEVRRPLIRFLQKLGKPFVILGYSELEPTSPEARGVHHVSADSTAMGRAATLYLASRGRKNIALITPVLMKGFTYELWHRGYLAALAEAGLPIRPEFTVTYKITEFLANHLEIDGLVLPDPGSVQELRESSANLTRIGAENMVVGVANLAQARRGKFESSALIINDVSDLAHACLPRVLELIRNPDPAGSVLYRPHLTRNMQAVV
jgi:DNA-binding LacI/PurR family transcriptional regulator